MGKVAIAVCFASVTFGQNVDRVFRLMNATAPTSLQGIATTMRTIGQIQQLSVDDAHATLTVKGTADQIALAEWLIPKLDVTAGSNPGPQEYRVPGDSDDVVVVYELVHAATSQSVQEIATTLRTVAEVQKIFAIITKPKIVTLRGSANQMALAEWLIPKLDVTAGSNPGPQEYRVPGDSDDVVVVYELVHAAAMQSVQEIATTLRTVAEIQRIFAITTPIVTLRGSANQMALAEFLLTELDQPAQPRQNAFVHEFRMTGGGKNIVVVYGLAHTDSPLSLQEIIVNIRTVLDIQRIFQVTAPKLLSMRGSESDVQTLRWLVPELDRQTAKVGGNEMRVPGGNDDVVHVFYLTHVTNMKGMNELLTELRTTPHIMKAFVRSVPAALVLRGTADQIATAGQIIELRDRAAP
jgi:hypothetical protein